MSGVGALPKYTGHKLVVANRSEFLFHFLGFFRVALCPCRPSALTGLQDAIRLNYSRMLMDMHHRQSECTLGSNRIVVQGVMGR